MTWNDPKLLWLLAIVPFVIGLLMYAERRYTVRLQRLLSGSSKARSRLKSLSWLQSIVLTVAFVLLVVGAAGPRWGWRWVESKQRGLDIMVAVDVSRSMDARDVSPSRLERARRMVIDLLEVAEGDRIGLIAFAGVSFVQCPLTSDHNAIRLFLDVLNTSLIPVQGTDLSSALVTATKSLTAAGEGQGKLLLLLSDGEDHGASTEDALADVKKAGIRVFTVGMGTAEGSPITSDDGRLKTDLRGNVVISKLQDKALKEIAAASGGAYAAIEESGARIDTIYGVGMRGVGTEHETRASRERVWFERYQWFAGAAGCLLLLEWLLRGRRNIAVGLVLASGAVVFWNAPAVAADAKTAYQRGVALSEKGDDQAAISAFEEAASSSNRKIKQHSLYNLGVLKAKAGDAAAAAKAFEEALALDPQDQQTRENLQWAKKQSQQQKDKKQDQEKDKQDNKDNKNEKDSPEGSNEADKKEEDKSQEHKENQNNNDQKQDGSDSSEEKPSSQDQQKSEQEKPTSQPSKEGQEDPKQKPEDQTGDQAREAKEEKQVKDIEKQEAEKLLRMIPDDIGKFYRPPSAPQKSRQQDEDW